MRLSCCAACSSAAHRQRQSRLIVDGAIVPSRPSRHFFSSVAVEQRHRLRQQHAGEMQARPFGVVGIGPARLQIAPVGRQRAIHGDRCAVGAAVLAARQLLRLILRLIERQHVLGVGILEIVGQREGLWSSMRRGRRWP